MVMQYLQKATLGLFAWRWI